jgi:16S rRNA processing protein RimM
LRGVETITQAEELVGAEVLVPEDALPIPLEDECYFHEIEGFSVVTEDGTEIGEIKDMISVPGNDLLVVAASGGEVLIPFASPICRSLDRERRRLVIDPPSGLLDLNEI